MDGRKEDNDQVNNMTRFFNAAFVESKLFEKDTNNISYPAEHSSNMDKSYKFQQKPLFILWHE